MSATRTETGKRQGSGWAFVFLVLALLAPQAWAGPAEADGQAQKAYDAFKARVDADLLPALATELPNHYKTDDKAEDTLAILDYTKLPKDQQSSEGFLNTVADWLGKRGKALAASVQSTLETKGNALAAKPPEDFTLLAADRRDLKADVAAQIEIQRKAALACLQRESDAKSGTAKEAVKKDLGDAGDFAKGITTFQAQVKDSLAKLGDKDSRLACLDDAKKALLASAFNRITTPDADARVATALASAEAAKERERMALASILEDGNPNGDPARRVICDWEPIAPIPDPGKGQLSCHPKGLLVAGDFVAQIIIRGLPTGKTAQIEVTTGEVFIAKKVEPKTLGCSTVEYCLTACAPCQLGSPLYRSDEDGKLDVELARDCRAGLSTSESTQRMISVFVDRYVYPRHRGYHTGFPFRSRSVTAENLRKVGRQHLSIVSRGDATSVAISLMVSGDGTSQVKTGRVPVVYRRWSFEAGGFFAVASEVDQELVTVPDAMTAGKVKVTAIRNADEWRQESGAFLTFFPDNYPMMGVGLGFSTPSGRPASIFLGPTVRLLGLGNQAVLTISGGLSISSQRHFPGIKANDGTLYGAEDAVLKGRLETELGGYALVSLGFQFGPIPGPKKE